MRQRILRLPAGEIRSVLTAAHHYEALGVAPTASAAEIKKSFHKLALKLHPDKNQQAMAEDAFKAIEEAHRTLSDARERRKYDASKGISQSPPRQRAYNGSRAQSAWGHYKYD